MGHWVDLAYQQYVFMIIYHRIIASHPHTSTPPPPPPPLCLTSNTVSSSGSPAPQMPPWQQCTLPPLQ